MLSTSVIILSDHSPPLGALADAVREGASRGQGGTPSHLVVVDGLDSSLTAPTDSNVFLGWTADESESQRIAQGVLDHLSESADPPRHVALFEASRTRTVGGPRVEDDSKGTAGSPEKFFRSGVERFVLDDPSDLEGREAVGSAELARARLWAAETLSRWHSFPDGPMTDSRKPETTVKPVRSVPWCGGLE